MLVSDGVWTGVAVLSTEVNEALWQVVGEVKPPPYDRSATDRCRLAGVRTVTLGLDQGDSRLDLMGTTTSTSTDTTAKLGFALLWSSSAVTIFPIA